MSLPANETYFELRDGECFRVNVARTLQPISKDAIGKLAETNGTVVPNMFAAQALSPTLRGNVGARIKPGFSVYTLPLAVLPMRARFRLINDVMVPDFGAALADSQMIYLDWKVPDEIRLFLLVTITPPKTSIDRMYCSTQHLVALDKQGRTYRMPTSNLYADCRLCTGEYDTGGITVFDTLIKALEQFNKSQWQSDLAGHGGGNSTSNSQRMFRYKPKDEGFEQLPYEPTGTDWTSLTVKIGNDYISQNITL